MTKAIIKIILLLTLLSSCASQKVVFDKTQKQPTNYSYKKNQNFFLWGVLQTKQSSPLYICDNIENIHSLEVKKNFQNVFLNIIFGGLVQAHIYTPRQSLIYCKNG